MPTPYNGGQSPLEYYAINGNVAVNGGLGRLALINQTTLKYQQSFKNPTITGNMSDKYTATHTNAAADATTPERGKGTGNQIDMVNTHNGITARYNYNGGDNFDINGQDPTQAPVTGAGLGRTPTVVYNAGLWGYGPSAIAGSDYSHPNTSQNIGQVII